MPASFDRCVKSGGRVRTINPKPGKYLHICYLNGKSYHGEVKTRENPKEHFKKKMRQVK